MDIQAITRAVVEAINSPTRPSALQPLGWVQYPNRQLQVSELADGIVVVRFFYRYKMKHKSRVPIILEDIKLVLNALLPNGLYVYAVDDQKNYIRIFIRRYNP